MKTSRGCSQELYDIVKTASLAWDKREGVAPFQTWEYHLLPVVKNAVKFAKERGADIEVVEVAALFHDYGSLVDGCVHYERHHIVGGEMAKPILEKFGYGAEFIERVRKCIFAHRASVPVAKQSVEEICISDADAVAHIENAFEIIMWRGQHGDSVEEGNAFVKRKMQKSFAKLSDEAKDYVRGRYEAVLTILY